MKNPLVSVVMITYSHEKYIEEAINGVLIQKFGGDIELIIANDNSPDHTDEIIQQILKNSSIPENIQIKYTKHPKNIGMMPNFIWALKEAKGKYVAICEGDDYWIDSQKLQKQVDFLEENSEYVLCFHKTKILTADGKITNDFITKIPENFELRKTLATKLNYIHTLTVVFRNIVQKEFNSTEFEKTTIGDYFLYMLLTQYGKIGFLNSEMAVYRHGVGFYSSLSHFKHIKSNILLFSNLYAFEKDSEIKEIFYKHLLSAVNQAEAENQKNTDLLHTRRHIFIEKIYKLLKK